METNVYRDGVETKINRPIRVSKTRDGHTIERLTFDKTHTYFVYLKDSPYCAHGKTVVDAITDATWKDPSKRPSLEELKQEIQAAGRRRKISLPEFRLLTGACTEGCRQALERAGVSGRPMTAFAIRDVVNKEWGEKLLNILEWNGSETQRDTLSV